MTPSALSRTYPSLARSIQASLPIQNRGDNACGAVLPAPRSGPLFQAVINDLEMVDLTGPSWNLISHWLRQVEATSVSRVIQALRWNRGYHRRSAERGTCCRVTRFQWFFARSMIASRSSASK
jgi:hypothetical protein